MRNARIVSVGACLLGLGLGMLGLTGCGDDSKTTGTAVPVDMAKEAEKQKEMSKFYTK